MAQFNRRLQLAHGRGYLYDLCQEEFNHILRLHRASHAIRA